MKYLKQFDPLQGVADTGRNLVTEELIKEKPSGFGQDYELGSTLELVDLVRDAAQLVRIKGEDAFKTFAVPESRWRKGESYIFVLDPQGNMLVHSDPELEGKNQIDLKDINARPIIRGLIEAVTSIPNKTDGWYHYQWPVPGGLLPRWKSSYVRLVKAPSGKTYIIGSGMYNDRMERIFVENMVHDAVAEIEKDSEAAFRLFHDPTGPFLVKDAYIFVYDMNGVNLVFPTIPNLEGRNLLDLKDTNGKQQIREMIQLVQTKGSGWVDYMWPKPGESFSTKKSSYVTRAKIGDKWVLVGCGVYLADAPREKKKSTKITAPELMTFVREGAAILQLQGENAFSEFSKKGSRWFHDDIYFFVFSMDGTRAFHAAEPETVDRNDLEFRDNVGRPIFKLILEAAGSSNGEGWAHYMYPEPGNIIPTWKSAFVKRVTYPSGKQYILGCGIYNMQMDKAFIEDVVERAASLIMEKGKESFVRLRDKTGPFVFMDTYVFVDDLNGVELVNPAQPSLEGKNLMDLKDAHGKLAAREYIDTAVKKGSAWVDYYWYKPGDNTPVHKYTYVRKVHHDEETYVAGAGYYLEDE